MLEEGANVGYHDPHIPVAPTMRSWPSLPVMSSLPLDRATLEAHDAAVVVTPHQRIDWKLVAEAAPLVVDTRGIYRGTGAPNVVSS